MPLNQPKESGFLKIILIVILALILLVGGFFYFATAGLRRSDGEVLKNYKPSDEVLDLAEKNGLTDKGKAALYRADPQFIDNEAFIKYCRTISRGIEALACIAPKPGGGPFGGKQIFLLKIDDPKFADHKYAASVHEMLHSIYQRLGSDEREKLAPILEKELEARKDDPHLANVVEILHQKKDAKDVQDELHSKFGVEYTDLSAELEDYYKQYFKDRKKVVELYQKGGFNGRVRKLDQLSQETKALSPKLNEMNEQLEAYKGSGDEAKFNSLIGQYNSMVDQYNSKVSESKKIFSEIETFYKLFNPNYKPPEKSK